MAATKSFTAQVMVGNLIIDKMTGKDTIGDPYRLGTLVEKALATEHDDEEARPRVSATGLTFTSSREAGTTRSRRRVP